MARINNRVVIYTARGIHDSHKVDRSSGKLNQRVDRNTEKPKTRMRPEQAAAARDDCTHKPVTRFNTKAQRAPPQGAPPKGVTFPFGAHDG